MERIASRLAREGVKEVVLNGGLSVSGLQHIGRLRGEVVLVDVVARELEKRGFKARRMLTLYTQDPWKGKEEQLSAFRDRREALKYRGWPLHRVPDPRGCHDSWVDHYWSDFGPYIKEFSTGSVEVVTTTQLYRGRLKEFVLETVDKRDLVRRVVNKYRGRKPYPESWIPVEPVCSRCGRIDSTEALRVEEGSRVLYKCNNCGYRGVASIEDSKLNWRIEWVGVWKSLGVTFEPYGKDHATPGGSRDSCNELARTVYGFEPPEGEWYEWVAFRRGGTESDMTSSGFVGITPREWLEVAHPEVLRFIYLSVHPHRRIVIDMAEIPDYYEQYYRAERLYYSAEALGDEGEARYLARAYELAQLKSPPSRPRPQVPYTHAAILAQVVGGDLGEALKRLQRTSHVSADASVEEKRWAMEVVSKAGEWARKYAPSHLRFEIPREIPREAIDSIKDPERLYRLSRILEGVDPWEESLIKEALIRFGRDMEPGERREFYRDFYLAIVGKPSGPRAAPLLALLDKNWVVERLREPAGKRVANA